MEYRAIYKCRLCGKEFEDCATCNKGLVFDCMIAFVLNEKAKIPFQPHEFQLHYCEDKSMGVADFKGWKAIDRDKGETKKDGN